MSNAVHFEALSKSFGKKQAVIDASLDVPQGSIYGFLGPNGAGKTTTIRMLVGLIFPDHGSIEVLGNAIPHAVSSTLRRVGAMIEGPGFIPYLSGEENLRRLLSAAGVRTKDQRVLADRALEAVGLSAARDARAKSYSMGMKQRLSLAWAISLPRELYILDEPTNGLDPAGMREVRELIVSLSKGGSTVLLSSHLLGEIDQICTHVALMSQGKILQSGSVSDFRGDGGDQLHFETSDSEMAVRALFGSYPDRDIKANGRFEVVVSPVISDDDAPGMNRVLVASGVGVSSLVRRRRSLEEIFLHYVGEGFDVR